MTEAPISGHTRDLDRWLRAGLATLHTSIGELLDVEAGLHDARLPALHSDLANALDKVLDVDGGLRAIIPVHLRTPAAKPTNQLASRGGPGAGAGPSLAGLAGMQGGLNLPMAAAAAGAGGVEDAEHKNKYSEGLDLFDDLPPAYPPVFGE